MYLIIGTAVISIGATIAAIIYDEKREKQRAENEKLRREIEFYHQELSNLYKYKALRKEQIIKEKFFILREKIFNEIDTLYKEKLKVKDELESYLNLVKRELDNKNLSSFYRQETYKTKNLIIYGLEKTNAYFRYLNYFKYKIEKFKELEKYHLIFKLPPIKAFLPDEYLFKGKLLEVSIDEFNKYNNFSQKIILNSKDEKFLKDINIVLIEDKIDAQRFIASISKGELAFHYKNKTFFEALSLEHERHNSNFIYLQYKNAELTLNKNEKKIHYRILKGEKLQVKIKGSDYLFNNVFVTQKDENLKTLFVVGEKFENAEIIDIDEEKIILFSNNKKITAVFKENYAEITDIKEEEVYEKIEPIVELKFLTKDEFELVKELISKKEFKEVKDYLLLSISARKSNNKFFSKYVDLLDYQIENNQYQTIYKYYKVKSIEDNEYILEVNIDFEIEKNAYVEIDNKQYLLKDYSKSDNFIKIDAVEDIKKEGVLIIYSYTYPYALIQQRKALNKFIFDQIVNKNIKNIMLNPKLKKYTPIFENLDIEFKNKNLTPNQKKIVKKALNEKDLFLIQGPPGTGKTTVIKEIIYQSKKLGLAKNILVVSQQNVAVDNVLVGVKKENIDTSLFRVASNENKVYDELINDMAKYKFEKYQQKIFKELSKKDSLINTGYRRFWYELIKDKEFKDLDESIKEYFIKNHNIIGATCVGLANEKMGLEFSEFDLVIIDEAGRATLGELLIPILKAKKVILIGDHKQLPPNADRRLMQKIEKDDGFTKEDLKILEKSYFEELYESLDDSSKAMLNEQFRMPNKIGNLISEIFYEGKLKNGRDYEVKDALNWIDVRGFEKREGTSKFNEEEAKVIAKMVNKFKNKSIAVITPYSAQKRLLRKLIKGDNIKIDTIDSFQGEEAEIVFYSLVRNKGNIQFLLDMRRLNVAISRTQEKLFFVGNKKFFMKDSFFREIINRI